ncbi:hypothetical protein ASZ78_001702, partial [Callipepla squamata]
MTLLLWLSSWSNISVLGVFLTVFTILVDFMKRRKKWSRYPPGPMSLPFVGTMPFINYCDPHLSFEKFRKKFGNIFSLQNCWTNVVVLNGYKTVKEALVNKSEDFADRPYFHIYEHLGYGQKSEGKSFADVHFLQELAQGGLGRPFDPDLPLNNAVCNLVCAITYGERFDYSDEAFKKLLTLFDNTLKEVGFLPQ